MAAVYITHCFQLQYFISYVKQVFYCRKHENLLSVWLISFEMMREGKRSGGFDLLSVGD